MKFLGKIKKEIRKNEILFVGILVVLFWVIVVIIASICYYFGWIDISVLIGVGLAFLLALYPIYWYVIKKIEQTKLISFTSKYLLEKEESNVDELLGILIAGKWEKLKIDPIEEFIKCIKSMCLNGDFEMKRRIAEALPALFKIDLEGSKELVKILRKDWDKRWKSDNRRRTIEALSHIINKEKVFVGECLHINDGDEIFTIIAMVEIIDLWREKINKKSAEKLFLTLKYEMKGQQCGSDEKKAISELWDLLYLIRFDPNQAIKRFEGLKDSSNIYIQICIARNLKHLCKRFPGRILNLMNYFLGDAKHKNVRRPIAKDDSVKNLFSLLQDRQLSEKAKETIWKLIKDEDDIIRLATFDMIEKILDIDREFGRTIIQHVIKRNRHPKLVKRAETLLLRDSS